MIQEIIWLMPFGLLMFYLLIRIGVYGAVKSYFEAKISIIKKMRKENGKNN